MKQVIQLENLSCQHCVNRTETLLSQLAEVKKVTVDLPKQKATVTGTIQHSLETYQKALSKTIYKVIAVETLE